MRTTLHCPYWQYIDSWEEMNTFKLFCFTDASVKASSEAVSLNSSLGRTINVILVFSKARFAKKSNSVFQGWNSLPCVLIGTKFLNYVTEQFQFPVIGRISWSDSHCVLRSYAHNVSSCECFLGINFATA